MPVNRSILNSPTLSCALTLPFPTGPFPNPRPPLQERAVIGITRSPEVLGVDSALLAAKAEFYQRELGLGRGELGALYVREPTTLLASLDRLQTTAAWLRCAATCCCSPRRFAPHPCCLPRLLSRLLLMADALFLLLPFSCCCCCCCCCCWWFCCVCRAELGLDGELLRKVVSKGGVTKYPLHTLQVGMSRAKGAGGSFCLCLLPYFSLCLDSVSD